MALLAIPLLVLFQQLAYAGEALTRSKAEELLDKGADASLSQWCRPGPELMRKPEFATLKDKQCGRMKVVVSGIRTLSPTEAVAEWMAVGEVDKAFAQQWFAAMQKFQDRLVTLSPKQSCHVPMIPLRDCPNNQMLYEFRDPSDGLVYITIGDSDIRQSGAWGDHEITKQALAHLAAKGKIHTPTSSATFQLWDDGWRLVKTGLQ